MLEICMYGVL